MSSSVLYNNVFQAKINNVQNQADTSAVYSAGVWSFKNSTALTSVTIDNSGNVGIGTASPTQKLQVNGSVHSISGNYHTDTTGGYWASGNNSFATGWFESSGSMVFRTATTERMRIDASGNLLGSGKTSVDFTATGWQLTALGALNGIVNGNADACATYNKTTNTSQVLYAGYSNVGSTLSQKFIVFADGNVRIAAGSTYGNLSDIKFKENIVDATPKLEDVLKLQVRNFTIKNEGLKAIGFIAQEFEQVFPALVVTSPDRDYEGNDLGTESKAIKESALIPILVKSIQELSAKVDAQAAEIEALKAK